jgi:diguanylate cyclase
MTHSAAQATAEQALAFLAQQWLPPTPQNYTLAYIAVTEPGSEIGRAVNAITDGGVRIRQGEADEIVQLYAGTAAEPVQDTNKAERDALRHQTIMLGEMASSAASATSDFTRDLSAEAEAFDGEEARTVQIVTRMIERSRRAEDELNAAVKQVESLRQELESARDDAERDQLTSLGNRRAIERHLQKLAHDGRRRAIGICDIDNFKSVNDRFGHGVGDRVLKLVANSLVESCAPHFVGRWGGEEFVVIMDGLSHDDGVHLLDSARADLSVRKLKLRENDEPLGVISFSAGVAATDGDHAANIAAIHRADASLYRAKAAGRNLVMAA